MEASEDPQVAASTEAAEVNIPADPRLLQLPTKPNALVKGTDRIHTEKIRQPPPAAVAAEQQQQQKAPPPQPEPSSSFIAEDAVLDEEKIHSTIDMSINPADVLSGRGKQSFNHGTLGSCFFLVNERKFGYSPS